MRRKRRKHFLSYALRRDGKTVRLGKGSVLRRHRDAVAKYLRGRYRTRLGDTFAADFHTSEAAALKAEVKKLDGYKRKTGHFPRWNSNRGGGGGSAFAACRASLADGRPCLNRAISGGYGYCGVHAR